MVKIVKFAVYSAFRNKRRTFLSAFSVVIGVFALLCLGGYLSAVRHFWSQSLIRGEYGHFQIFKKDYLQGDETSFDKSLTLSEQRQIYAILDSIPQVELYTKRVSLSGLVGNNQDSKIFMGSGIEIEKEKKLSDYAKPNLLAGKSLSKYAPRGVQMPSNLARKLGLSDKDEVLLLSNSVSGSLEGVLAQVRGVCQYPTDQLNDFFVVMPYQLSQELTLTDNVHRLVVLLKSRQQIDAVVRQVLDLAKKKGLQIQIRNWQQLAKNFRQVMGMFNTIFLVVTSILILVISVLISNTIYMSVMERTSEIATMRAIGINRKTIFLMIVFEGLVIALIGYTVGSILAYLASLTNLVKLTNFQGVDDHIFVHSIIFFYVL